MFSRITLAWLSAFAFVAGAGCRDSGNPGNDMGVRDLGGTTGDGGNPANDMSVMKTYADATIHAIDTATMKTDPAVGAGVNVKITGAVVTTPISAFVSNGPPAFCRYQLYVQDPQCSTPPCGIVVVAKGPMVAADLGGAQNCPDPTPSNTIISQLQMGDVVDLFGKVDWFQQMGVNVVQHEIDLDMVTKTGSGGTVTPFDVTDPGVFVSNTGTGWAMYEGTLVRLVGGGGGAYLRIDNTFPSRRPTFDVVKVNGATTSMPATFSYTYLFNTKITVDGGTMLTFPTQGMKFDSILGVPNTLPVFRGQVNPRQKSDFSPQNGL